MEGGVAGVEVVTLGVLWGLMRRTPLERLRRWREVLWCSGHVVMAGFGPEHAEGEVIDKEADGNDAEDEDLGWFC